MATPFTKIYSRAIFRFADYQFLEKDIDARELVLENYLMSAKSDFQRICKVDLTDYDEEMKQFNQDLDDEIVEILALGIAYYWVSFKVLNSELLKNVLNSKDYYHYSPANLLKEMRGLRSELKKEFQNKVNRYSYANGAIGTVKA